MITLKRFKRYIYIYELLSQNGFEYIVSDKYDNNIPPDNIKGYSEFNCLFKNSKM